MDEEYKPVGFLAITAKRHQDEMGQLRALVAEARELLVDLSDGSTSELDPRYTATMNKLDEAVLDA